VDFKKTRVKQIITAIKTVKVSFKELEDVEVDDIKDFYLMSIENRLNMIEDYLESLNNYQPEELDKLQADYNNLLSRYRGLQQRHKNLIDNITDDLRRSSKQLDEGDRFSQFSKWELNSIALALEGFNKEHEGIINAEDYQKLMKEIEKAEEKYQGEIKE
jgi:hypothetical protein